MTLNRDSKINNRDPFQASFRHYEQLCGCGVVDTERIDENATLSMKKPLDTVPLNWCDVPGLISTI